MGINRRVRKDPAMRHSSLAEAAWEEAKQRRDFDQRKGNPRKQFTGKRPQRR